MATSLSEDEIDDLLYFARTGDAEEFDTLQKELCNRENISVSELLTVSRDEHTGNGILHMAAANGHYVLLRTLTKFLAIPTPHNPTMLSIINAQNHSGNTPLHWAALNGHLEAVKVLLEEGADPTIANQRGHDAVYEAELNDKSEVVDWVLKEGGEGLDTAVGDGTREGEAGDGDGSGLEGEEGRGSGSAGPSNERGEELDETKLEGGVKKMEIKDDSTAK